MVIAKISFLLMLLLVLNSCSESNKEKVNHSSNWPEKRELDLPDSASEPDSIATEPVSLSWRLVPGVSAGSTKINEDSKAVFGRLGKPDGGDAAMGKSVAYWYSKDPGRKYSTSIYTVRKSADSPNAFVKQIRVTSPSFKTQEGIGVNSSKATIEGVFKITKNSNFDPLQVYDTQEGIAFEFSADSSRCTAVVIYEKGKRLPEAYLSLKDADKR